MTNTPLPHDNGFIFALQMWVILFGAGSIACIIMAIFIFKANSIQAVLNSIYFLLLSSAMWRLAVFGYHFQKNL